MAQTIAVSFIDLIFVVLIVAAYFVGRWVERKGVTTANLKDKILTDSTAGDYMTQAKPYLSAIYNKVAELEAKINPPK